jgi:aspartate racemase
MKIIGMLGGMSWESSTTYYQLMNREVQRRLGGVHSARCLMHSFDFGEIAPLQDTGDWATADRRMVEASVNLERAGAGFIMMLCNTMHRASADIEAALGIPFLHIADPLAAAIKVKGLKCVGLIGTIHTMQQDGIIKGRLRGRHGIEVIVPDAEDAATIHRVIYEELIRGVLSLESRAAYRAVMARLVERGAEGIILGCTEIPLLVTAEDSTVPQFDTTTLHAMAAVDLALA